MVFCRIGEPELIAIRTIGDVPRLSGEPVRILGGVALDGDNMPLFDVSASGSLVYVPAGSGNSPNTMYWVTRQGARQEIALPANGYAGPRISPDGESLAVVCRDRAGVAQIHMLELRRGVIEKLTSGVRGAVTPVWHPGGNHLAFSEFAVGSPTVRLFSLEDYSVRTLHKSSRPAWTSDYTFDASHIAFSKSDSPVDFRVCVLNEQGDEEVIVDTQCRNICPRFSPSGEYLAYASNESGRWDVYVRPFHRPGRRIQVSIDGGSDPVWARDGTELFYRNGDALMAVRVESGGSMRVGQPEALFDFPFGGTVSLYSPSYDVHPDGNRFVMVDHAAGDFGATELVVVRNWGEELKKLLPPEPE